MIECPFILIDWNSLRVRCQIGAKMCEAKPPHKQCLRRKGPKATPIRSLQVARKTPIRIWSLSQDATEERRYPGTKIGDYILDILILLDSGNAELLVTSKEVEINFSHKRMPCLDCKACVFSYVGSRTYGFPSLSS